MLRKLLLETQQRVNAFTSQKPRLDKFYKYQVVSIHKPDNPGHHFVSGTDYIMDRVSDYFDSILFPYAIGAASYLKDATDFLKKLASLDKLSVNAILATIDVTTLYTNISSPRLPIPPRGHIMSHKEHYPQ